MPPADSNKHDFPKPLESRNSAAALPPSRNALLESSGWRGAPLPPVLSAAPNALGLLKALRRRWPLAVSCGLALATVAAVGTWYFPGLARSGAYSLVKVSATQPKLVFAGNESGWDFEKYQKTQAALVRHRAVLEAALREPEVAAACSGADLTEKVENLERDLVVDFTAGPEVMRITLKGERGGELVKVVEAVTREFLQESAHREQAERTLRLERGTAATSKYEEELRQKRQALREQTGSYDNSDPNTATGREFLSRQQLASAEADLLAARSELAKLQAELETRHRKDPNAEPVIPAYLIEEQVEAHLQKDALIEKKIQRMAVLEEEINETGRVAKEAEARTVQQRRELAKLKAELDGRREQLRESAVKFLQAKAKGDAQADTAKMSERVTVLQEQEKQLAARTKRLNEEINGKGGVDLAPLRAEVAKAEDVFKKVAEQAKALQVELDAPPRVTALQEAVVAPRDTKRQVQLAGLAGLGTFGCVLLGIAFREFRSRRIGTLDDVSQGLGMRLLGAMPKLPDRIRRRLGEPNGKEDFHWHHRLNESIDVTRTLLLHESQAESLQVVLVTSALEGEGKTSLASHLAASLARAGRKTLLLDSDLRKPAAHKLFDLPLEPGLSELLCGEVPVTEVIRPTRLSRLWLISAGICDGHATQALAQENVQGIFEELRGQFDYVIIDSSPVLPVADTLEIAPYTDGVILSILRDESQLPTVYAAGQRLSSLGVRVLGAVVSGTRGDTYGTEYQNVMQTAAR